MSLVIVAVNSSGSEIHTVCVCVEKALESRRYQQSVRRVTRKSFRKQVINQTCVKYLRYDRNISFRMRIKITPGPDVSYVFCELKLDSLPAPEKGAFEPF